MNLRNASINDYNTIYHIADISWQDTYSKILSQEQMEYMLKKMYSPEAIASQMHEQGHVFLIIEESGEAFGFVSYQLHYTETATKIHKLYLLPSAQGNGAGKTLINTVEAAAVKAGDNSLVLNVNRFNPAYHFYLKTGFINRGEENVDIGNGFLMEDYIMQKPL